VRILGLYVLTVVDDSLVQAAEAGGAIHGVIIDIQCLEYIDHEIAAA
jgi:hypothetical protein